MFLCRLAVISLPFLSLSFSQEAFQSGLADNDDPINNIRCVGHVPKEFLTEPQEITEWCKEASGALCYRHLSPVPPLIFVDTARSIFSSDFTEKSRFKQFCSIKCNCAGLSILAAPTIPPRRTTYAHGVDFARLWHFDLPDHVGSRQPVAPGQSVSIMYEYVGETVEQLPTTGDPINRPTCSSDALAPDLAGTLNVVWKKILHQPQPFKTYTELCAHHFYGGNNRTNAGGICLPTPFYGETREFAMPYELRAPIFAGDVRRPVSLSLAALPGIVDAACREACECRGSQPQQESSDLRDTFAQAIDEDSGHPYEDFTRYNPAAVDNEQEQLSNGEVEIRPDLRNTCSGTCSNRASCSGDNCRCYATETVDPRYFGAARTSQSWKAVCRSTITEDPREKSKAMKESRRMGLFPLKIACPCNVTYVSRACCDSQDGLIWEPPEMKLGEMIGG